MQFYLILLITFAFTFEASLNRVEETKELKNRSKEIHKQCLILDSHTDTPLLIGRDGYSISQWNDSRNRGGKLDFPRMKAGGLDAVFFAVFVGQGELTPKGNEVSTKRAFDLFANIDRVLGDNHDLAELALHPDDAYRLKQLGKCAVYIGLENAYPIGNDLSLIKGFYDLGARYITLSHTRNNDVCDASTDEPKHYGLSDFGEEVVREMNRIGMMVDVSHISDQAFFDVLDITTAPIIASHSNARAICDHPRNLSDSMLYALRDNGGVVQVCILSEYVKKANPYPERDSARQALREKFNNF